MNSQDSDEEKTLSNSVTWHNRYLERRKEPSGSTQENAVKLKQATAVDSTHKSVCGTWHTGIQWLWLLVKGTCNPMAHQCQTEKTNRKEEEQLNWEEWKMTEPLWKTVFRAEDTTEDLNYYIIPQSHTTQYPTEIKLKITQKSVEHTHKIYNHTTLGTSHLRS